MFPFKLAGIEAELHQSRLELHDITNMYREAEDSRHRHVVCIYCRHTQQLIVHSVCLSVIVSLLYSTASHQRPDDTRGNI